MTQIKEDRPGVNRADDDRPGGVVTADDSRPNRRSAATWTQRHRGRVDRIFTGRDPWTGDHRDWSDSELRAVELAAEHLRSLNLYGAWQCPESARQAWRCRSCPCQRDAA
jgi:hypothetical protein